MGGDRSGLTAPHPGVDGGPSRRIDVLQHIPVHQPARTGALPYPDLPRPSILLGQDLDDLALRAIPKLIRPICPHIDHCFHCHAPPCTGHPRGALRVTRRPPQRAPAVGKRVHQ